MILKRVGGKSKIADWIKFHMPSYRIFVDVFGGSGAVLDKMLGEEGCRYVYNDLDHKLYVFFKMLQGSASGLEHLVRYTPYSRQFFDEAYEVINSDEFNHLEDIDQALTLLIVNRQSFGAKMTNTWSIAREGEIGYDTWKKLPALIRRVSERWRSVFLENLDYSDLIPRWDSPQTTFYLDPPYEGVESEYYDVNKSSGFDHEGMFDRLQEIEGSYVISYYDGDVVSQYAEIGCQIVKQDVKVHIARENKATKTEVLVIHENEWARKHNLQRAIKGRQSGDMFK